MNGDYLEESILIGSATNAQALDWARAAVAFCGKACCAPKGDGQALYRWLELIRACEVYLRHMRELLFRYPEASEEITRQIILLGNTSGFACMLLAGSGGREGSPKTYIIRDDKADEVKIGKSVDPYKRIQQITMSSGRALEVLAIIDDDIELELHRKFESLRTVGEWFNDAGNEISIYISQI